MPEIEIAIAQAWTEVDEVALVPVRVPEPRYEFDLATLQVIERTVLVPAMREEPTGRRVRALREGVRFDELTGKFYEALSESDFDFLIQGAAPGIALPPQWIADRLPALAAEAAALDAPLPEWVATRAAAAAAARDASPPVRN